MTELYSAPSSISPFTAILWCLYPIAVLVIVELLLGGGFDDDNNFSKLNNNIDTTTISLFTLTILIISSLSWFILRTLKEGRKALAEINKDRT